MTGRTNSTGIYDGSITRAKLAQNALYSPIQRISTSAATYAPDAACLGKTIVTYGNSVTYDINITEEVSAQFPDGAEIAVLYAWGDGVRINFSGDNVRCMGIGNAQATNTTFAINERYGMAALKLINIQNGIYYWLVTGNVEVVS